MTIVCHPTNTIQMCVMQCSIIKIPSESIQFDNGIKPVFVAKTLAHIKVCSLILILMLVCGN